MSKTPPNLQNLTGPWLGSQLKVQLLAFFRENPGVIETIDGLAQRLGVSRAALEPAIEDHVDIGILRRREMDDEQLVMYDRSADARVQQELADALERRRREGAS